MGFLMPNTYNQRNLHGWLYSWSEIKKNITVCIASPSVSLYLSIYSLKSYVFCLLIGARDIPFHLVFSSMCYFLLYSVARKDCGGFIKVIIIFCEKREKTLHNKSRVFFFFTCEVLVFYYLFFSNFLLNVFFM